MRLSKLLIRLAPATVALLVALFTLAYPGTRANASMGAVRAATPISSMPAAPVHFLPPAAAARLGDVDPTSTLTSPAPAFCSVRSSPSIPVPRCSTGRAFPERECSVLSDQGGECSAFLGGAGGIGFCSVGPVQAGVSIGCSTLHGGGSPVGDTVCSTEGGGNNTTISCSIQGDGGGKLQICSAEQPAGSTAFQNLCSARFAGSPGGNSSCSVIRTVGARKAVCTAFRVGDSHFCSALTAAANCSVDAVQAPPFGLCTSLRYSGPNTCTVAPGVAQATCSVIGGTQGDPCGAQ